MRIEPGGSPSSGTRLLRYRGIGHPMLREAGGALRLAGFTGLTPACDAWASGRC